MTEIDKDATLNDLSITQAETVALFSLRTIYCFGLICVIVLTLSWLLVSSRRTFSDSRAPWRELSLSGGLLALALAPWWLVTAVIAIALVHHFLGHRP